MFNMNEEQNVNNSKDRKFTIDINENLIKGCVYPVEFYIFIYIYINEIIIHYFYCIY